MSKRYDLIRKLSKSWERPTRVCPECNGEGVVLHEFERPQGFSRDVGYIDTKWIDCLDCYGDGEITMEDDESND